MNSYFELKNIYNKELSFLYSENEIFNIPYSMKTFFNKDESKIFSKINLNLITLLKKSL